MSRFPTRVVTAAIAAVVVVAVRPEPARWSAVLAAARGTTRTPRLDDVAALVAGTALWCLAVWVVLALAAGRLAALPGAAGATGRALVRVGVPRLLRGVVLGGVAGGLLLGPAVSAVATPVWPTSPAAGASTPGPAWPVDTPQPPEGTAAPASPATPATPAVPTIPAVPATPAMPATPPAGATSTAGATSVVVTPGDSLWSIAAGALTRDGRPPDDARVAAAWPAWFAANRAVIGSDPGLLRPGTHLSAPPPTDGSAS